MNGLEKEYGERIAFKRVNILNPNNTAIMEQYGFSTTPELYLVDGQGKVIAFWDEVHSPSDLRPAFDAALRGRPINGR